MTDEKRTGGWQGWALSLALLSGVGTFLAIAIYAGTNTSGHTGFSPYGALIVFAPVTLIGIVNFASGAARRVRRHAAAVAAAGLTGIALLVYLDLSNSLLHYEEWIRRGMP